MTDLFEAAAQRRTPAQLAARALSILIDNGTTITRAMMNATMTSAYGGNDASGRWTQRDSFEVLEHALALSLSAAADATFTRENIDRSIALMNRLPTQTVRSEEQLDWQQFSTPVDLAAVAVMLADAQPGDVVLEPSAGNGLLVCQLPRVAELQINELNETRRGRLADIFPGTTITGHDGAAIASTLADKNPPSLILMNPPFSRSLGRGTDHLAAVRHLAAAITHLRAGGRIVAIMPDWFSRSAKMREIFESTLAPVTVRTSIRLEQAYTKHGTSIAVRLYVLDKMPGSRTFTTIQRRDVAGLADSLEIVPRTPMVEELRKPAAPIKAISLFGATRKAKPAAPRIFRAPVRNNVLPVGYKALETPAPLLEQAGVYLPYRPSRVIFDTAGEHPTALVESVAMGSIPAPIPQHIPQLPERTVSERLLSASQLETVVYAGHAWGQWLPGKFKPDPEGVGLMIDEEGASYRKGFFVGDGTGAGKGRQVAATILDNWLQGRRRAIWISKNEPLLDDARRDWAALGGLAADVQSLSRWKIHEPLTLDEGVLFVSYPTLRSARGDHSRLEQLIRWAGEEFDGVIAFDEAHEMGGVAGGEGAMGTKKGSQQGIAGVLLQNRLPKARVLYASATGASEVNNLAYAVRLGLWGPETAFASREAFISEIRAGGIAAMELVARDLKATGLYMARALSFAGVEYDILRHELTPEQIAVYDTYADAWAIIHRNLETALELTGIVDDLEGKTLNSGAKAAARSRFESCKQRFFGQVLLSMKLPTIISAVEQHLAEDKSVVLQLVTTAESILNRRLGELSAEERAELDIELSPLEYCLDYLTRAFPTRQMEVYTDDTGEQHSRPMSDEHGNPVTNPQAEAARAELIEHICALPPIKAALDALLERFGHDNVAEVTGRSKRIIPAAGGQQKLETRTVRSAQADAAAFMDGTKRILIFSDAGGTGRSYHASLDVPNQQQRVHLLLEPGWRADRAIQGLGRTHRTHQASAPLFRPVTTDCKGELRFTSTIARRLDSLGALTRGQRQTGGQNLFDPADNLESEYAKAALVTWFHLLVAGKLTSTTLADFEERTGLALLDADGVIKEDLPPIQRWLNRLLALPIGHQNVIFDEFLALVETRVAAARDAGTLDIGVETMQVETATILEDTLLRTDPVSGATSHLLTIEVARRRNPVTLERVLKLASADNTAVFLRNGRSGKVALRTKARSGMTEEGTPVPRVELLRPTRREFLREHDLFETAWEPCGPSAFATAWSAEAEEAAQTVDTEIIRIATGLLLPIWSALPSDHLAVNRIVDAEGKSWLGRMVFPEHVGKLLKDLGVEAPAQLSPSETLRAVQAGGSIALVRPVPCELKRSRVNGSWRIEITGAPASQLAWFKSLGCFTEVIQYRTRLFVPTEKAEAIITALIGAP
ncbi:strawberry notch-like NTP hydrolase domain-containing protein [Erythrobacter sp. CCH5-A1]|uniref:strawberry notch-like NTP hydrolase domain-containing protein n=1 Tax=Erythrobacter sp. CCH5-A1 TaxID=1768792 RepID=UPI00082DEB2D|nr:strawberry notch family protein [Erythrobacter sp. CCH5-A1]